MGYKTHPLWTTPPLQEFQQRTCPGSRQTLQGLFSSQSANTARPRAQTQFPQPDLLAGNTLASRNSPKGKSGIDAQPQKIKQCNTPSNSLLRSTPSPISILLSGKLCLLVSPPPSITAQPSLVGASHSKALHCPPKQVRKPLSVAPLEFTSKFISKIFKDVFP